MWDEDIRSNVIMKYIYMFFIVLGFIVVIKLYVNDNFVSVMINK